MDIEKISNKILYILFGISAVVVLLFFAVGFNRPYEDNPTMNDPILTDVLLIWMILLCVGAFGCLIWSFSKYVKEWGFQRNYIYTWGLPIAAAIIGLIVGLINQNQVLIINGENWCVPSENILADVCIISTGILLLITIGVVIYSLVRDNNKQ